MVKKIHDYVRKLFSLVSWLPIGHLPVGPIQAIRSSSYACMMSDVIGRFQMAVVVATTSYKRRSNICRRDEWVSLRLEFWSARPNLTRCFPVLSIVFFFLVVRHSHSIHSFLVLSICDSWLIAASTLCFQTLLLYYGKQQKTINISQSFPDRARLIINILICVISPS